MKIIGFSGKKQSGKTTAAEFLMDTYGGPAEIVCFADELKDIVCECFGAKADDLWGTDTDKDKLLPCGKSGREVLQIIGTDWFRSLDSDCWIRAYKGSHRLGCIGKYNDVILTPDVRFPNEVKCIQDLGGHVIRLLRAPFPDDKHESETALNWLDGEFFNPPKSEASKKIYEELCFDAFIDNRDMTILEQSEAVWKLVNEKGWI